MSALELRVRRRSALAALMAARHPRDAFNDPADPATGLMLRRHPEREDMGQCVATNGHIAIVADGVAWEGEWDPSRVVVLPFAGIPRAKAVKLLREDVPVTVGPDGDLAVAWPGGLTWQGPQPEGRYLNLDSALVKANEGQEWADRPLAFNPRYVQKAGDAAGMFRGPVDGSQRCTLTVTGRPARENSVLGPHPLFTARARTDWWGGRETEMWIEITVMGLVAQSDDAAGAGP